MIVYIVLSHFRSTLKATLFMLPLFGIPHLIASQRNIVNIVTCDDWNIYYFVIYSVDACQSILVAVLFCYLNKEVQSEIRKLHKMINIYNITQRRTTGMTDLSTRGEMEVK